MDGYMDHIHWSMDRQLWTISMGRWTTSYGPYPWVYVLPVMDHTHGSMDRQLWTIPIGLWTASLADCTADKERLICRLYTIYCCKLLIIILQTQWITKRHSRACLQMPYIGWVGYLGTVCRRSTPLPRS